MFFRQAFSEQFNGEQGCLRRLLLLVRGVLGHNGEQMIHVRQEEYHLDKIDSVTLASCVVGVNLLQFPA